MMIKAENNGSPFIGIFSIINDNYALVPPDISPDFVKAAKKLDVDIVRTTIANTNLLSHFAKANNNKLIITKLVEKDELKLLKDLFSEVIVIEANYTALGNLVAINDNGIVCASQLTKSIKDATGVTVAGSDLVGSSIYANNKAFITHPDTTDAELKKIQKVLKVDGGKGTINFGDPMLSTGIIGNKKGVIIGTRTSGPEMNRIDDIFILD